MDSEPKGAEMNARNSVTRTVTMSAEAWEILRLLADTDLRKLNAEMEFIIREFASQREALVPANG